MILSAFLLTILPGEVRAQASSVTGVTGISNENASRDKVNFSDIGLSVNKIYTFTDNHAVTRYSFRVVGNNLTSIGSWDPTDASYQFAFVVNPDNSSKVYLYNIAEKAYVHKDKTISTGSADAVYLWPGRVDNTCAITFSANVVWGDHGTGTTKGYYVVQGGSSNLSINDWAAANSHQSYSITEVPDLTFTEADIAEAQRLLKGYQPKAWNEVTDVAGTKLNSESVYTLKTASGQTLTVSGNTLSVTASPTGGVNEQFAFVTSEDNTKVYLYNIGIKKFVASLSKSMVDATTGTPGAIHLFDTQNTEYPFAISFAEAWSTVDANGNYSGSANSNFNVSNSTLNIDNNSGLTTGSKFSATVVENPVVTYSLADARWHLKALTAGKKTTLADLGIVANTKKYRIFSKDRGGLCSTDDGKMYTTAKLGKTLSDADEAQQFVFVTDPTDETKVYLYSVGQEKFVSGTASGRWPMSTGSEAKQVYTFETGLYDYFAAFAFNENATWNGDNHGNANLSINTAIGIINGSYNKIDDDGSRFQVTAVGDFPSDALTAARSFLSGTYEAKEFSATGLTTNNKVYRLKTENGGYLSASGTNLASSTTDNDNAKFMFFTPTTASGAKVHKAGGEPPTVYLYSVGAGAFVTAGGTLGEMPATVYAFETKDTHGYTLGLALNATWSTAPVSASSTKVPDRSNRFQTEEVAATAEDLVQIQQEAQTILQGYYEPATLQDLGIDPEKVYYITSDVINNNSQHVILVGSNRNNNFRLDRLTQNSNQGYSDVSEASKTSCSFAFVTDADDPEKIYLYSVGQRKAASQSGDLVNGSSKKQRIYLYKTNNKDYPVAFAFTSTWKADGAVSLDGSPSSSKMVSSTTTLGAPKRFRLAEVTDGRHKNNYQLAAARRILNLEDGTYELSNFVEADLKSTKVYKITAERDAMTLYAGGSSLTNKRSSEVTDGDANAYFAFVTDPEDTTKVYLYSVGQKRFVNLTGPNGTKYTGSLTTGIASQIYVYNTYNDNYPFALSFSDVWADLTRTDNSRGTKNINTGGNLNIDNWSGPDGGNRLTITEVTDYKGYSREVARKILQLPVGTVVLTQNFHYKGASEREFLSNGMQDVAEVHYYYYVTADTYDNYNGHNYASSDDGRFYHGIELGLPLYNYNGYPQDSYGGNPGEPQAYFRWYDYNTDQTPTGVNTITKEADGATTTTTVNRLVPYSTDKMHRVVDVDGSTERGLIFYNIGGNAGHNNVGVVYNIPTADDYENWKGDVIACDVSRYHDYNHTPSDLSTFQHEPTLSVRYIFHILPAESIADSIMNAAINTTGKEKLNKTYEDNQLLVFGALPDKDDKTKSKGSINIRAALQSLNYYYFYPVKEVNKHHIYHPDGETGYDFKVKTDFDTSKPVQAKKIEWRVYNSTKTAYRVITTKTPTNRGREGKDVNITLSGVVNNHTYTETKDGVTTTKTEGETNTFTLQGGNWVAVSDASGATTYDNAADPIELNKTCYLVGYLVGEEKSKKCPFFNAQLDINTLYPMSKQQIKDNNQEERSHDYLENHFPKVANFTFDDENDAQNHAKPTDGTKVFNNTVDFEDDASNFSLQPSNFRWRQYGFVYYNLRNYSSQEGVWGSNYSIRPFHGEYSIEKQMNVGGSKVLYDRTHERDNSQYGYFLRTDCSQEARQLGHQDFIGSMCGGTKIIVSAWVSNFNTGAPRTDNDQPELRFSLYGVRKNSVDNSDISKQLLASICSGKFDNNIEGYKAQESGGIWYQVFGEIVLPDKSVVDNYSDFRVVIDNYCQSTKGADYCIDDIMVYQANAKVTVLQDPTMCGDEKAGEVKLKIRANWQLLQEKSVADAENKKKVFFRFFNTADGQPATGVAYNNGDKDYGEVEIASAYDAEATLTDPDNTETLRFETTIAGVRELVLANRSFNLEVDKQYYVALAFGTADAPSVPNEKGWGKPSNICSFYSGTFSLVKQTVIIDGSNGSTTSFNIDCSANTKDDYEITVQLSVASKIATGMVRLEGVPFDWFVSTADEWETAKTTDKLDEALRRYRDAYKDVAYGYDYTYDETNDSSVYTRFGQTAAKDQFTEADRTVILKYLYDPNKNQTGKLLLLNSATFTGYPFGAGRHDVQALPAQSSFEYNGTSYSLCTEPQAVLILALQNGPSMEIGIEGVTYPSALTERAIRIGFPQIRKMRLSDDASKQGGDKGELRIPILKRSYADIQTSEENLRFVSGTLGETEAYASVHIVSSNDPVYNDKDRTLGVADTKVAEVSSTELPSGQNYFGLCHIDTTKLHEGYWYQLAVHYVRTNELTDAEKAAGITDYKINCIGDTYFTLKIVPEYLTWRPTFTTGYNSNWNRDDNWQRSTAKDLNNPDYRDYRAPSYDYTIYEDNKHTSSKLVSNWNVDKTLATTSEQPKSYVPMYFSKVTIPQLVSDPYPMMPYIQYSVLTGGRLISRMTNSKNESGTANIQYDMMAVNAPDAHSETTYGKDSVFKCVNFDGNVCDQIFFKQCAQLRDQQYLRYQKASLEASLPINKWNTLTTPMKITVAGDLYLPKLTAQQQTPLFQDITFDDKDVTVDEEGRPWTDASSGTRYGRFGAPGGGLYSRLRLPVYQRLWGHGGEQTGTTTKGALVANYDNPRVMLIFPDAASGDNLDLIGNKEGLGNSIAWSHPFNVMGAQGYDDEKNPLLIDGAGTYATGKGVALKIGDDYAQEEALWSPVSDPGYRALLRFPKDDVSFDFYKRTATGEGKGGSITVMRDFNHRLGVDYDFTEDAMGRVTNRTTSLSPSIQWYNPETGQYEESSNPLRYDLVGNPYTASILVDEFISANRDVLGTVKRPLGDDGEPTSDAKKVYCVWTLFDGVLNEFQEGKGNAIYPGQAFFIKLKNAGGKDDVIFTVRMQTDPLLVRNEAVRVAAATPAMTYRVADLSDVEKPMANDDETMPWHWRAGDGWLTVVSGTTPLQRIVVYRTDGTQVKSVDPETSTESRVYTGPGLFILRIVDAGGRVDVRKIAVR